MLPEDDPGLVEPINLGPTWFLLYYRSGDTIRSELSLAKGVSDTGTLLVWSERLILPELSLLEPPPGEVDDLGGGPPVDVPVSRRAG